MEYWADLAQRAQRHFLKVWSIVAARQVRRMFDRWEWERKHG